MIWVLLSGMAVLSELASEAAELLINDGQATFVGYGDANPPDGSVG